MPSVSSIDQEELKVDPSPGLEVPRLELRSFLNPLDDYGIIVLYRLIYRHFDGRLLAIRLGETKISSLSARAEARQHGYIPMRDGCHIRHDADQLRLNGFVISINGRFEKLEEACYREGIPVHVDPMWPEGIHQ